MATKFPQHHVQVLLLFLVLLIDKTGAFSPLISQQRPASSLSTQSLFASSKQENIDSSSATTTTTTQEQEIWNEAKLMEFASNQGVVLSLTTLGPGYRAIARAKHDKSLILGYVEGFLRPGGSILHLDKMEVFRKSVLQAKRKDAEKFTQGGTVFGVGLLMGYICLLYGKDNGYTEGEFLAIDDEEKQHRKLVQFYKRSGFEIVRYVGDGVRDIPDRLLWGGCGTLMRQDIDVLLQKWTRLLSKSKTNKPK